jgi:hypothetical protein
VAKAGADEEDAMNLGETFRPNDREKGVGLRLFPIYQIVGFLVLRLFRSTDRGILIVLLGFLGFSDQIDREGDRRWVFRSD